MLNMRSAPGAENEAATPDPARDRILRAGLEQFAEHGFRGASVRAIAAAAEVSPALVLHHYGSKDGLRRACDERLMEFADEKESMLASDNLQTAAQYIADHPETVEVMAYLRRTMVDGGEIASRLFEQMCARTEHMLRVGIEAGTVRPVPDVEGVAVTVTAWSLGALLIAPDVARLLGDGESNMFAPHVLERYSDAGIQVHTRGLLTEAAHVPGMSGADGGAAAEPKPAAPPADRAEDEKAG